MGVGTLTARSVLVDTGPRHRLLTLDKSPY